MAPGAAVKRFRLRGKRPGRFHHGDLREALVEAASRAVDREGHAALSLRPLAGSLAVSQPAVYRHFGSKEDLLAAVAARGWLELDAVLEAALASDREPVGAVRASARAYVRWAMAHPHRFRLMSSRVPAARRARPLPPLPREHYHHGLGGAVPIDDPRLADAFRAAWGLAHGLSILVVEHVFMLVDTDEDRLAAADGAIDVFAAMLRATWPPAKSR